MVGALFLMIIIFFFHGQIETVHICNRATCFTHHMKFPAILVQVHFYLFIPPLPISQTVKIFLMDLSISCNILEVWFKCIFYPPPPPLAKQWKIFFIGFSHFMKFPGILVQVHFLCHPPRPNSEKNFLMDLSIS